MLIPSLDTQFLIIDNIYRCDIYYDIEWRMPNVKFIDAFMKLTFIHSIIEQPIQRIDYKIDGALRSIRITVKINLIEFFYNKNLNLNLINEFLQQQLRIDWISRFHFLIQFTYYEIYKQTLNNKCINVLLFVLFLLYRLLCFVVFFVFGWNKLVLFRLENSIVCHKLFKNHPPDEGRATLNTCIRAS